MTVLVLALGVVAALASQGGGAQSAGETCDRRTVAGLVRSFVRAYNEGDAARLESIWAAEPDFEWYSVSPDEREQAAAFDRETLMAYFEERHGLGDRLDLQALRVGPADDRGAFGIAYRLRRESDQRVARGGYHGKASARQVTTLPTLGGVELSRCVLFVWSMGTE